MYRFNIKIADLIIGITCTHELTRLMCAPYITDDTEISFSAKINESDKEKLERYFLGFSNIFSEDYIESTAIFEKLCTGVIDFDCAVFHSALISYKNEGVAFAAPSGVGKTTHIKLWKKIFADEIEIVNGDKPLFSLRDGIFYASGMPWSGKEGWNINKTVPLKAICFIDRAENNSIELLKDSKDIMKRLFEQLILPEQNAMLMVKYLNFANNLIKKVPFYLLKCNMDEDAARVAFDGIFGEHYED